MTRYGSHTESRMRGNCTYGSMRGRAYPTGESRSTLHPIVSHKMTNDVVRSNHIDFCDFLNMW